MCLIARAADNLIDFQAVAKKKLSKFELLKCCRTFEQQSHTDFVVPVFMVTKSCIKISNISTRFSCQHFAVEDFVTLSKGEKSCRWGNVMFGHGSDKLV